MMPRVDFERTENIVNAAKLCLCSVDSGCPAGIVYLGEYYYTTLVRLYIVFQLVGLIRCDSDDAEGVLCDAFSEYLLEFFVGNCLMAQRSCRQRINFIIGIVNIVHLVNQPCVAVGVWIL